MIMLRNCLLSAFLLFQSLCFAQQCGNCKLIPTVVMYDLDVQVNAPSVDGKDSTTLLEWQQLFWYGKNASATLFQTNKSCLRFVQPANLSPDLSFFTKEGVEVPALIEASETLKIGLTNPNLPPAGNLSKFGDYILTGYVRSSGEGYTMHVELQTSCERKVVASASASFQASTSSSSIMGIAKQVAAQLSPLAEKIKTFELAEKQRDKSLTLFQTNWSAPIKVTPQKQTLKAGESTSITIEVKDCDGQPIAGRDVLFDASTFEGFSIQGTLGGTVSPAKVTTDANGIAKASFTLKTGAKEALISVHSPGNDVKGCSSMLIGDAAINIRRTYKGFVKYKFENSSNCSGDTVTGCLRSKWIGNESMGINYTSSFYDNGQKTPGRVDVQYAGDDQGAGTEIPRFIEGASYGLKKVDVKDAEIVCEAVGKGAHTIQKIQKVSEGELKYGFFRFSSGSGTAMLDLHLVFTTRNSGSFQQTALPSGKSSFVEDLAWDFSIIEGFDTGFTFKKETVGGKIKYTVSGTRNNNPGCGLNSTETIYAEITED